MSTPNLNLNDAAKSEDSAEQTPPAVTATPVAQAPVSKEDLFAVNERNPSEWDIQAAEEDGYIVARNGRTQKLFEGTIAEFNQRIRG